MLKANGTSVDWKVVREDFPILDQEVHGHPLIYFDNAASSQKPRAVIQAMTNYYEKDHSNVHRGLHELSSRATAAYEAARDKVAHFLNASSDEVIFTRGTTESINLVARAWGDANVSSGDIILTTELEHHSNLVPWQLLAERREAELRFIPVDNDGRLVLTDLESLLSGPVKILSFTHISNSLGTVNPAKTLCEQARLRGIPVLVDAAQSAAHFQLDVRDLDCDFLTFSGHKMCGPTGIGVLYGKAEVLNGIPPFHGGGEMIAHAYYDHSEWKEAPQRFEAGTPAIAEAIGLGAAVDYLEAIGREEIHVRDEELKVAALDILSGIKGVKLLGPVPDRAALFSFVVDGVHAHDIISMANQYGLALRGGHHCTQPLLNKLGVPVSCRASLYFYNTIDEVHRMGEILKRILTLLA